MLFYLIKLHIVILFYMNLQKLDFLSFQNKKVHPIFQQ